MGILRSDRVSGLGGANAITGSTFFSTEKQFLSFDGSDINFDTGDFTVEAYVFHIGGADDTIISDVNGWTFTYGASGNLRFYMATGSNAVDATSSFISKEWVHVAVVRSSGTLTFYQNGTAVGSHSYSHDISNNSGTTYIGKYHSGVVQNFIGNISNLRVVQGTALYTGAFTPPTSRLEKTSDTVLLTCNSASNVLNEETGKSLMNENPNYPLADQPGPVASRFAPDVGEDYGPTFADNTKFDTLSYMVPPGGTTTQRGRDRGVMMGGAEYPTSESNIIEYIRISSGGITKDFGDLTQARGTAGGASSSTRGVMIAGISGPTRRNTMDYITIATTGNALDFGDYIEDLGYIGGLSNQTRGISAGGNGPSNPSSTNQMGYITIATTANAQDFGDLTSASAGTTGSASPTRGLFALGTGAPSFTNQIDYITIATTGNGTDFGDMSRTNISSGASCASQTRALFAGGYNNTPSPGTEVNNIDYVTIASTGNSTDFGDLTIASRYFYGTSNGTRGVFSGRMTTAPTTGDPRLDSVIIATLGDAVDWGYMNRMECGPDDGQPIRRRAGAFVSDSHGGIS